MRTKADRVGASWYRVSHHVWDISLMYGKGLRGWSFAKARRWFIVTLEEGERERSRVYPPETQRAAFADPRHPPSSRLASTNYDDTLLSKRCSYKTGRGPLIPGSALCRIRHDIIAVARFAKVPLPESCAHTIIRSREAAI